jgi:hypothetical protein
MGLPREVRRALVLTLTSLALSTVARLARADGGLTVTRDEGAAQCPDGEQLRRLALASAASSSPAPTHAYRVSFERSGGAYRAEIVDDTAGRSRRLEDTGADCAALTQAAAVVVATMWSSEHDASAVTPAPAPPPAPASPPAIDEGSHVTSAAPSRRRSPRGVFGLGAALAAAIVRPLAPALFADVGLEFGHASLAVGAIWIPTQHIDVAPGSIHVGLVGGSLRGCAFVGGATEVGLCAKVLAGELHGAGAGYSSDAQRGRPWFALEPDVFVDRALYGRLRARAAAGATVPLHAEAFDVTGASTAYDTPGVGGLFSLSIELATP